MIEVFVSDFEVFTGFPGGERALRRAAQDPCAATGERASTSARGRSRLHDALGAESGARPRRSCAIVYTSLTTPATTYESGHRDAAKRTLLKREPVLGDFDPRNYTSEFIWVPARDGERMPVSIVRRKDVALDGTAPLYQYGYGSYGLSIGSDVQLSAPVAARSRLRLRDRAHPRRSGAGQTLVRRRPAAATSGTRSTTSSTSPIISSRSGYCARDKVFAAGGSAGGSAGGRHRERCAREICGPRGARAVRRHRHDDAR